MSECRGCYHGVAFRRTIDQGLQSRRSYAFCALIRQYMPPDVQHCSQFTPRASMQVNTMLWDLPIVDPRRTPEQYA